MAGDLLDGGFRLGVGIEDTFVPNTSPGRRSLDEYELTQHYGNWRQDLALVRRSGAQVLRYGLPWYRINPERGKFSWSWADEVVDELAALQIPVIVDLVHYGTPLWLDNQFLNRNYACRDRRLRVRVGRAVRRQIDELDAAQRAAMDGAPVRGVRYVASGSDMDTTAISR